MVSIGVKYYGAYRKVPDNHQVIPDQIYESRGAFSQPIPSEIALGLIKDWRNKMLIEHGIVTNYIEVSGQSFMFQWKVPRTAFVSSASAQTIQAAIPWGAVLYVIYQIAIAAIIAAGIYYGLTALSAVIHETGQVLSLLGPENISMVVQIFYLFFLLMLLSPLISLFTELPRRIMPPRKE